MTAHNILKTRSGQVAKVIQLQIYYMDMADRLSRPVEKCFFEKNPAVYFIK